MTGQPTLTARQAQILALVADGHTSAEIGRALFLSISTVKLHMDEARRRLGARTRAQAVVIADRAGLLVATPSAVDAGGREPVAQPSRYTVNCMPEGSAPDAYLWALQAELGRDGKWSVTDGHRYLSAECEWFHTRHEAGVYALDIALAIAKATAPYLTVNGLTPDAALARIAQLAPPASA